LLDTYQAERHPIARSVLRGTHLGTRLVLAQNPLMRAIREWTVPAIVNIPSVRRRILTAVSQLSINYRGSSLSVDSKDRVGSRGRLRHDAGGLRAGDRVPDATLLDTRDSEPVTLFDLISQGWTLLLFLSKDAMPETIDSLQRIARQAQEAVGEAVRSYLVLDTIAKDDTGVTTLLDPSHQVSRLFAADSGLVALVRPDGYLGYRGRPDQPGELASYLARVFAMQLREAQTDSAGLTERMG
jgi:hypothetical protein